MTSPNVQACRLSISGMDCPNCAAKLERGIQALPGVMEAQVDFLSETLTAKGSTVLLDELLPTIKSLGFNAQVITDKAKSPNDSKLAASLQRRRIIEVCVALLLVVYGGISLKLGFIVNLGYLSIFSGMIVGGYPIAYKGFKAATRFDLDMNFLMVVATIGAVIIGETIEGGAIIVLFAVAELLEAFSMDRSRKAVRKLMELTPQKATVDRNGFEMLVQADQVKLNEIIVVKPGATIPLDGTIQAGHSSVNQATITGESMPVERSVDDEVLAGTINGEGALRIQVTQSAGNTTLDKIIRLVEQAQAQKAPMQQFVEKFARYYTPIVVGLAILTAIIPPLLFGAVWAVWIYRALALLVISCPCALVISTPVTVVSALAGAARRGVLVKGGVYLENIHKAQAFALDKTGTITEGKPTVTAIHPLNGTTPDKLLKLISTVEAHSEHPIAQAILERSKLDGITWDSPVNFKSIPGKGASAEVDGVTVYVGHHGLFEELGICDESVHDLLDQIVDSQHTVVMVGTDKKLEGIFAIADKVRPESANLIKNIRSAGARHIAMLTGDNSRTGEAVGRLVGITDVRSQLLPQDKVDAIISLKKEYGSVVMVGDGVNDAPALAVADVGIAMGGTGSDATLETADVVLMSDRIDQLPWLLRLSRKTRNIIVANITGAIGIKLIFIALAATGNATLWMAVFADMGVSLMVIFNGLRALKCD